MTRLLFRSDPYLQETEAVVTGHSAEGGVLLDETIFFPTGGGQPGDSGRLIWERGQLAIATTTRAGDGSVVLVPGMPDALPAIGTRLRQRLDWERRYRHMRMHTALHLLSVVIPLPVTGGQIGAGRGRLDFDMPDPPGDLTELNDRLNALVGLDLAVSEDWITDEELVANPGLVKTLSVRPPMGQGRVRLVGIGSGTGQVDLQPCGGTHVARTAEIGRVSIDKVEKKGRMNRRVSISLSD